MMLVNYWDYTEMYCQQNIILRRTVSKTLYWDARSAKHYTEMHGQQNIILRCTVSKTTKNIYCRLSSYTMHENANKKIV